MNQTNRPMDGISRRRFLQGAGGGAVAGSAFVGLTPTANSNETSAPATRSGITRYPAEGLKIELQVNGTTSSVHISPDTTLLVALRESLGLTGTKEVCDRGACGACTVLVDGRSVNSCMMLAIDALGHEIVSIEGLGASGQLDPVQEAFIEHDACQCGYCIPGFAVRSRALLDETPHLTREQVKQGLCGNICRCAAYVRILDAVTAAATREQS
mgnify:CR=1 FL=1